MCMMKSDNTFLVSDISIENVRIMGSQSRSVV